MRHKSGRGKDVISTESVISRDYIPSGNTPCGFVRSPYGNLLCGVVFDLISRSAAGLWYISARRDIPPGGGMRTHATFVARFDERTGQPMTEKHYKRGTSLSKIQVHTARGGILAGEEMERAYSTTSEISRDCIPSAKQVRECGARLKVWI